MSKNDTVLTAVPANTDSKDDASRQLAKLIVKRAAFQIGAAVVVGLTFAAIDKKLAKKEN